MNTDIRLSVSFKGHRKRAKLRRILGDRATDYLIDLWITVSMDRPDGDLKGFDETDIAIMAGWQEDPKAFVAALINVGFLDIDNGDYRLHDWVDHNPWASSATERSDKSRFSKMASAYKDLYEALKAKGYTAISAQEYKELTAGQRPNNER
jgi:hypothetical protein